MKKSVIIILASLLFLVIISFSLLYLVNILVYPLDLTLEDEETILFDEKGERIQIISQKTLVPFEEIPLHLQWAFLAIEDMRFYEHKGLDPLGLIRAFITNLRAQEILQGGSTITQQLAKITFLSPEKTMMRKIQEGILALRIEEKYTKDEILYHYLNRIYLGHGVKGVGQASQFYFQKDVSSLTLEEGALLAGITKAPNYYSPLISKDRALFRRNLVLKKMEEQSFISIDKANEAKRRPLSYIPYWQETEKAPYFQDYIQEEILDILDKEEIPDGLRIHSTLNLPMQEKVEEILLRFLDDFQDPPQLAVLVLDPHTGAIKAMIGGREYGESSFNRVTMARRQSGSTFKPITFALALEKGLTPLSFFFSEPTTFQTHDGFYQPENYNRSYHYQEITLREALRYSDNVVAVKIQEKVGILETIELANRLGIKSDLPPTLSLVLGTGEVTPLEMALAYSSFASGGFRPQIHGIERIKEGEKTIYQREVGKTAVLSAGVAYIMTSILEDVIKSGTGQRIVDIAPPNSAGKTGTSQDNRDVWFIGYTPSLLTCVWIGYDRPRDLKAKGGELAAPLWGEIMKNIAKEEGSYPIPNEVNQRDICTKSYEPARSTCPEIYQEFFLPENTPHTLCQVHGTSHPIKVFEDLPVKEEENRTDERIERDKWAEYREEMEKKEEELKKLLEEYLEESNPKEDLP